MAGRRVVVVGDVMLDRYVTGSVSRISPEAPIPILLIKSETARPGGAGNVARNLAALGLTVELYSVVGRDTEAELLREALAADGIKATLHATADRRTTTKTRHIAGSQQLLRTDREETHPITAALEDRLIGALEKAIRRADAVVISDYGKGCLTERLLTRVIGRSVTAKRPIVVDPFGRDWRRYRGASILKPNRAEVTDATGIEPKDDASALAAAQAARRLAGVNGVLLSRAEAGLTLDTQRGTSLHLKAEAREVADVTGAGDSVVATMAAALAAGADEADAARLANLAGGIAVAHIGAYAVTAGELKAALLTDAGEGARRKIVDRAKAAAAVAAWRASGLTTGFTNGVFDLLHPGHVGLIAEAKRLCDRLVVAINADASVRRLKGPGRPVQNEAARALVLAGLGDVDLVVVFPEDTPVPLLKRLKPDVLVKGGDYRLDQVVGADLVKGWGGKVKLAHVVPGHSTSATVRKMKR